MIVEEIISEVLRQRDEHFRKSAHEKEPQFYIYIGHDLFCDMMSEIPCGCVSGTVYEVATKRTIYGNNIFRVEDHEFWKVFKV